MSFSRMFRTALRFLIVSSSFWRRLLLRMTLMTLDRLTTPSSGRCGSFLSYFVMKVSMSLMAFSRAISFGLLTILSLLWLVALLSPINLLKAVNVFDGMFGPCEGSPLLLRLSLLLVWFYVFVLEPFFCFGAALGSANSLRTCLWLTLLQIRLFIPVCVPVKKPIFVLMNCSVCLARACCYSFLYFFNSNSSLRGIVAWSSSPL